MLEVASSDFLKAANYLRDHFPISENLTVHVVKGYDTIETPTGKGFGVFVPETLEIYIAGEMPEKEDGLIKTLAHEFKHYLQYRDKKPFDEAEADAFAEEIYKKIKRQQDDPQKARKQLYECIETCLDCDGIVTHEKNCGICGVTPKVRDAVIKIREARKEKKRGTTNSERKYVIVCNEHSAMWNGALLFWGNRTEDGDKRSFGGYTSDINKCELYSEKDLEENGYHFSKYHKGMTREEFRKHRDIAIEPDYLLELGYKKIEVWYMP